jgi:hypothetical protein
VAGQAAAPVQPGRPGRRVPLRHLHLAGEFSLTQLGKPVSGRAFFEQVIRDNLGTGRPEQVSLIFGRRLMRTGPRSTPLGVPHPGHHQQGDPEPARDYKHITIKQYHKEGRELRTETTINNTRDFRIGKRLTNLPALREVGFSANRRLLRLERLSHDPITGAGQVTASPARHYRSRNLHPRFPLAHPRSHALFAALLIFRLLPRGFTNLDLRDLTAQLRGLPAVSTTQMTYDLRRLRSHQLIERISRSPRYRVTSTGLHTAMFLTRVHDRILPAGLDQFTSGTAPPTRLRTAATAYQAAIDDIIHDAGIAA